MWTILQKHNNQGAQLHTPLRIGVSKSWCLPKPLLRIEALKILFKTNNSNALLTEIKLCVKQLMTRNQTAKVKAFNALQTLIFNCTYKGRQFK